MLQDSLAHFQKRNENFIAAHLQAQPLHAPKLLEAIQYGVLNGGKRVRPFLVYSVGELLGAELENLDYAAAAIECIHAYSLIHDDLPAMDNDTLRRGKPTCHIAFDEATAILAGDALQTLAFELLSSAQLKNISERQQLNAIRALAKASGYVGMCGGQSMDIEATGQESGDLTSLESIHAKKTGALIIAAVELGVYFSPHQNADTLEHFRAWAQHIGHAFQIHDDILDVMGNTETLGKMSGADAALNKMTYPSLLGMEQAIEKRDLLVEKALHALSRIAYNSELLVAFTHYLIRRDR